MPLFTTPNQFLALVLVLIAGWFFGLASRSGGAKWRNRYASERDAHAATRRAGEQRHADDQKRIVELERENARLGGGAPAAPVQAQPAAHAAYPGEDKLG